MNDEEQAVVMPDVDNDKAQAEQPAEQPGLPLTFTFFGSDSIAFRYERAPGISPWQMLAIAEHLRIEAELELQAWILENRRKSANIAVPVMPPPPARRGVREVLKGGRWKPPAERK